MIEEFEDLAELILESVPEPRRGVLRGLVEQAKEGPLDRPELDAYVWFVSLFWSELAKEELKLRSAKARAEQIICESLKIFEGSDAPTGILIEDIMSATLKEDVFTIRLEQN